jgi:uncharacterized protein YebE (UPF0316 family)
MSFIGSSEYGLIILPLLIFTAKILEVSLDTIRIVFISKGFMYLAPVVGFFEILIWLLAIGQIFQNLNNIVYYIAYAGGFAAGNFAGMYIENKLALGMVVIRVVTNREAGDLVNFLKAENYIATSFDAEGHKEDVKVIYIIIDARDLDDLIKIIKRYSPNAFYSVENVKFVSEKIFHRGESWYKKHYLNVFRLNKRS